MCDFQQHHDKLVWMPKDIVVARTKQRVPGSEGYYCLVVGNHPDVDTTYPLSPMMRHSEALVFRSKLRTAMGRRRKLNLPSNTYELFTLALLVLSSQVMS